MRYENVGATVKSNDPNKTRAVRAGAGIGYNNIGTVAPDMLVRVSKRAIVEQAGEAGVNSKAEDVWWYGEGIQVKEDKTPRTGWIAERRAERKFQDR